MNSSRDQAGHEADQHQRRSSSSPRRTTRTSSASRRSTSRWPADAEATLPALIEAVKSAIPRRSAAHRTQRGEAAQEGARRGRSARTRQAAAIGWDASPISTARLCMETYGAVKDLDWSIVVPVGNVSNWLTRLWPIEKHHHWLGRSGGYGVGYGAPASVGAALANRDARSLLGRHPVRRRPDVRARRAVDRREAQDPAARGHAQQPRLASGSDARAAHGELPQPRSRTTAATSDRSARGSRTPTSNTTSSRSRWAGGRRARSRKRRSSRPALREAVRW